jgi:hypothetical protein
VRCNVYAVTQLVPHYKGKQRDCRREAKWCGEGEHSKEIEVIAIQQEDETSHMTTTRPKYAGQQDSL